MNLKFFTSFHGGRRAAVVAGLLVLFTVDALAQAPPVVRRATGLRPPTAAEQAWMDENWTKVGAVQLNQLGVERVNTERRIRGQAALPLTAVPLGTEVRPWSRFQTQAVGDNGALPPAVDNSTLPSFPPVRRQGSIGSCASFSTTYYVGTHMLGLARGWNNKNNDNTTKLSPKFTYAMVNDGEDQGSWFTETIEVLRRHGSPSWADWPYSGVNTPSSYREWARTAPVWRNAVNSRMGDSGVVQGVHTAAGLQNLKRLLANGYALLFATDVYGWQEVTVANDPGTTADDPFAGERAVSYIQAESSGHAMTVVGYNDDLWIDINKNGVVDPGEKGAVKICNSWGTDWGNDGFMWLAYDALRTTTAVAGVTGQVNRAPGSLGSNRTPWWYNSAYYFTARPAYTPRLLGQFTLSHKYRAQLRVRVGVSATSTTTPTTYFQPGALQDQGGAFAFDGTTTAGSGTFVFDLSDLAASGARRYYLEVSDTASGDAAGVSDFRLTDATGLMLAVATTGLPGTADNSTTRAFVDYGLNAPVITSATSTNGTVGRAFSFTVVAAGATSFGATGLPAGLGITAGSGVIAGTPTQAGTFAVALTATSATGTGNGGLTITINAGGLVSAPGITSPTTAGGTVGVAFSYGITASNAPTSFGASGLPAGLSVDAGTGAISGIPTAAGSFTVTLSAANAGGTGQRDLALTINPPALTVPVITSATTASVNADSPFSYRITASNSPTSFGATGLPTELTVNAANGQITGTPSLARQYSVTLSAANASGTGYQNLTLTVLGDSSFGPANDNFANRAALVGTNLSATGGTANATAQPGEPPHAGTNAPAKSIWWTWTAPASGVVTLSTVGSTFDTLLAVYTGEAVTNLTSVAANDDAGGQRTSQLTFNAAVGVAYQIAVDGFGGTSGDAVLNLSLVGGSAAPVNDTFANALALTGANASTTGRNTGASAQAGEPAHAGLAATNSVWWTWTAPASGGVTVSTVGSDFDTVLAVYTGASVNALTPVADDDQSGGDNTSLLNFTAVAGTTYRLAVDGYQSAAGNIVLNLAPGGGAPGNDNFAAATVLTGATVTTSGANTNATAEADEPAHAGSVATRSLWWAWTAPLTGPVQVDTVGSSFDTVLGIYTGTVVGSLTTVASDDDSAGNRTSKALFNATSGTVYRIAVDGFFGTAGTVALQIAVTGTAPANDNFANRIVLTGADFSTTAVNLNATAESGEPAHAGTPAAKSLWWRWTAPSAGRVEIRTTGSSINTRLAIYTGTAVNALTAVVANNDEPGAVAFTAAAGTTYQIAVDGFNGAAGDIVLTGALAANVLYATDFETFLPGAGTLVGYDDWLGLNDEGGVSGIVSAYGGRAGYLGYNRPSNATGYVLVYRPVNFAPVAQGRPIVNFSVDLEVIDSTTARYDKFSVDVYNRAGQYLAAIVLDNANLRILREDGSGGTAVNTGIRFANSRKSALAFSINYTANTWSAALDDTPLFSNAPFTASGNTLDLGEVVPAWRINNSAAPGDNYLIFDNYILSAIPTTSAPIITEDPLPLSVTIGGLAVFEAEAAGTGPLRFQWRFKGADLPGQTNSSLSLLNVTTNDAGLYRVAVSNFVGSALSLEALLTVTPPVPSAIFGAPTLTSRGLQFQVTGTPGRTYRLETSGDLQTWTEVSTLLNQNGTLILLDPGATNSVRKFYRMREGSF